MITFAARCGAATVLCGRASATISAASAQSSSSGGRWRRQPGLLRTSPGTSAGFAHAADSRRRRRCIAPYAIAASGSRINPDSRMGSAKLMVR
jgi:hypothetical protein